MGGAAGVAAQDREAGDAQAAAGGRRGGGGQRAQPQCQAQDLREIVSGRLSNTLERTSIIVRINYYMIETRANTCELRRSPRIPPTTSNGLLMGYHYTFTS